MEGKQILLQIEDPEVKKEIDNFQKAMEGTAIAIKELAICKSEIRDNMWKYIYKTFPQFKPEDDLSINTQTYTIEIGSHSSFLNDVLSRVCIAGCEELPKKEDMN